MTEKIKFKAANPLKIMKYNHDAQGAMVQFGIFTTPKVVDNILFVHVVLVIKNFLLNYSVMTKTSGCPKTK